MAGPAIRPSLKKTNNMKNIVFALLIFLGGKTYAQTVSYKVLYDNPVMGISFMPNWSVDMQGRNNEYGNTRPSMYVSIPLKVDYKDFLSCELRYDMPLIKKFDDKKKFEIGATYHLKNKVKTKNAKLVLWSVTGSGPKRGTQTVYTKYIMVPALVRRTYSARGGFFSYSHAISVMNDGRMIDNDILPFQAGGAIATDGTEFGGAVTSFDSPHYNIDYDSRLSVKGIYVGVSTNKYKKIIANIEEYGNRRSKFTSSFYFDFLFGASDVDNLSAGGTEYDISGAGSQGFEKRKTGWRIGYEFSKDLLYAKAEFGKTPGLKTYKTYFGLTAGFYFNIRKNPFDHQMAEN